MSVAEMRIFGDPVLTQRCREVAAFDESLRGLAEALRVAMHEYRGVGVAANQIGVSSRVFVYDDDGVEKWLVNPEISDLEGEQTEEEGCLSVPGLYFPTMRAMRLTARGRDLTGVQVEFVAEGLLARIMQHETDHLNGMLYLDRLDVETRREAMRQIREQDIGSEVVRRTI